MATIQTVEVSRWREWRQKHPDFPLTVHPTGMWSKKVRGKVHYFGPLHDPEHALRLWNSEKDYLLAGEAPPVCQVGMTVGKLCDLYKEDATKRRERGEISKTYFRDMCHACQFIRERFGESRLADGLKPANFSALREAVAGTGRNLRSQKNLMCNIRAVFRWAWEMDHLEKPIKFGPRFKPPSIDALSRERETCGTSRFIDREAILKLLKQAKPKTKAMILLGINCGFYASDTIALTFNRLHLDGATPYHDLARIKNGRRRMAVLWPETVSALRDYVENHRGDSEHQQVFLAQDGGPYGSRATGHSLKGVFEQLCEDAGVQLPTGVGIGSLRHTYGTVVDLVPDQKMIDLTMGHTNKSIQKRVYSQLNLDELRRLQVVADTVHKWLYDQTAKE